MDPPARSGLRAAWPWLLLAGALALFTLVGPRGGLPEGRAAPALVAPMREGSFDLAAERGRVVVLAFWATWCAACRAEAPALSRLHARGARVFGVSVDALPLARVDAAARRFGMTYPIALATRADAERFGVEVLPTIYVIAPDGRVAASFTGAASERALREAVDRAR